MKRVLKWVVAGLVAAGFLVAAFIYTPKPQDAGNPVVLVTTDQVQPAPVVLPPAAASTPVKLDTSDVPKTPEVKIDPCDQVDLGHYANSDRACLNAHVPSGVKVFWVGLMASFDGLKWPVLLGFIATFVVVLLGDGERTFVEGLLTFVGVAFLTWLFQDAAAGALEAVGISGDWWPKGWKIPFADLSNPWLSLIQVGTILFIFTSLRMFIHLRIAAGIMMGLVAGVLWGWSASMPVGQLVSQAGKEAYNVFLQLVDVVTSAPAKISTELPAPPTYTPAVYTPTPPVAHPCLGQTCIMLGNQPQVIKIGSGQLRVSPERGCIQIFDVDFQWVGKICAGQDIHLTGKPYWGTYDGLGTVRVALRVCPSGSPGFDIASCR